MVSNVKMSKSAAIDYLADMINGRDSQRIESFLRLAEDGEIPSVRAITELFWPGCIKLKKALLDLHKKGDAKKIENFLKMKEHLQEWVKDENVAADYAGLIVGKLKRVLLAPAQNTDNSPSHTSTLPIYNGNSSDEMDTSGNESGKANDEKEVCSYGPIVLYDKSIEYTAGEKTGNVLDGVSETIKRKGKKRKGKGKKRKGKDKGSTGPKKKKGNEKTSESPEPLFESYVESTPEDYLKQKQNIEQFLNEEMYKHKRGIRDPVFEGSSKNTQTIFVKEINSIGLKKMEQMQWFDELTKRVEQSPLSLCELIHIFALYAFDKLKMERTPRSASYWFKSALGYAPQTMTLRITFRHGST